MDAWDYERNLGQLTFQPQDNHWFQLQNFEDARGIEAHEGIIKRGDSNRLRIFLEDKHGSPEKGLVGRLRLLYSYSDPVLDRSPSKSVSWKREDFEEIISKWYLPKRYSHMLASEHVLFAPFHPEDAAGRFAYIFSTFFQHTPFWSFAASFDPEKKTTYVLLHCESIASEISIERLKDYLIRTAPTTLHPLLIPTLVADLETTLTLRDCEQWKAELKELEAATGENPMDTNGLEPYEFQPIDYTKIDFAPLMHRMNACSVFVRLIERECEGVLVQLSQIREAIDVAAEWFQPSLANAARGKSVERRLREHINFLLTSRKLALIRLNEVQRGVQTQLAVVYNFIAQRDNKLNISMARDSKSLAVASKHDSSAMKTIAVLTMVFLPATFLASFFAMPFFDWQSNSIPLVAKSNFWVYFAVTIPLTLLVLAIWAVWMRFVRRRHDREDEDVIKSFGDLKDTARYGV